MDFLTTILFFGATFFADFVSGDNNKYPLLDAKGMVGVRNCGTKNDLIKITSLTHSKCDKVPCELSSKGSVTISVEFVPLESIASLSTCVKAVVNEVSVPIFSEDTCKGLTDGKCPFVKGETYVQAIPLDIAKQMPSGVKTVLETTGKIDGDVEVVIYNPDKTSLVCVSFATHML